MRYVVQSAGVTVPIVSAVAPVSFQVDKNGAGFVGAAATSSAGIGGAANGYIITVGAADIDTLGSLYVLIQDGGGTAIYMIELYVVVALVVDQSDVRAAVGLAAANLDAQLAALTPLTAAGVRAAVGLAAANLDAQLAAIGVSLTPAQLRAAVGLAAANLDAQLAAIGVMPTPAQLRAAVGLANANLDAQLAAISAMTPAQLRAALGLAAANIDQQFANIGPTGTSPSGIRQALGVKQPNLDDEINARNAALEELLQRFPVPSTVSVGERH